MQLSYAQNLEDVYLDRVFAGITKGTYVDVGGGHPVADNVSFHAYLKGWRGLVVEPQDDLAALYAGIRPRDVVVSSLAGRIEGAVDFHVVEGMHGLSSAVAANAETARKLGAATRRVTKTVTPLSTLIDRAGLTTIHFLKIDVEGAEPDVLAGLDLTRHRPEVILVEAVNPNNLSADVSAWEPRLLAAGYAFTFFDTLNRYYVANEHAALASHFPKAPADWNSVGHLWDWGRASQRPEHPDRALADVLIAGLLAALPVMIASEPQFVARLVSRGLTAAPGPGKPPIDLAALLGTGARARLAEAAELQSIDALLKSDLFRAALGRIACMYDGGHLLE